MKKSLLNKLDKSVSSQAQESRDKFANADLIIAMQKATGGRITPDVSVVADPVKVATNAPVIGEEYKVLTLPISVVKDHPRNARHVYDPSRVDEMATSIARDGQQMPAVVMPDPVEAGTYLLIEGRYRKKALLSLGRDTIVAAIVQPLSELEAYRLSLELNEQRNEQTALDNALAWKSLLDDGIFKSQEHIAEFLNLKQATVSKTLAILDLPVSVLGIIKTNPASFGMRVGYEMRQLAKTLPDRRMEEIAEQVREGNLTVKDLERLRERGDRGPVSRERSRAYPLQWEGKELGFLREFEDGRLKIDLSSAPVDLRERIIEAVKKVLSEAPAT